MLDIDHISERNAYPYYFPTIDFKFQNTGTATAFLWQFSVNILQAEVDPAPILNFTPRVKDNNLLILTTNNGWGDTAFHCEIEIIDPVIAELFPVSIRQFHGNIKSGETVEIFRFTQLDIDQKKLNIFLREKGCKRTYWHNGYPYDKEKIEWHEDSYLKYFSTGEVSDIVWEGLGDKGSLKMPVIAWKYLDDKDTVYEGEQKLLSSDYSMTLSSQGFDIEQVVQHYKFPSDITYVSMINPLKEVHEKKYLLSRKVPLGDIDRFHIMIGAPMSCRLLVQFRFYVDRTTIIESEKFDIKIWKS